MYDCGFFSPRVTSDWTVENEANTGGFLQPHFDAMGILRLLNTIWMRSGVHMAGMPMIALLSR